MTAAMTPAQSVCFDYEDANARALNMKNVYRFARHANRLCNEAGRKVRYIVYLYIFIVFRYLFILPSVAGGK